MTRTIGAAYKKRIRFLVDEANRKGILHSSRVQEYITLNLPIAAWSTWEGAHQEIVKTAHEHNMRHIL